VLHHHSRNIGVLLMIFPLLRFWRYTPPEFAAALLWNTSELLGVPCPHNQRVLNIIMGQKGLRVPRDGR
jgi:hypothetical protein